MPVWTKVAIDSWTRPAGVVNNGGRPHRARELDPRRTKNCGSETLEHPDVAAADFFPYGNVAAVR